LLQTLHPHTRLAVCCAMSLPQQVSCSALVSEWKRTPGISNELPLDTPAVFLFGR
jgi:16S rRNA (cytidine1402-2'-O)-methyltransferase